MARPLIREFIAYSTPERNENREGLKRSIETFCRELMDFQGYSFARKLELYRDARLCIKEWTLGKVNFSNVLKGKKRSEGKTISIEGCYEEYEKEVPGRAIKDCLEEVQEEYCKPWTEICSYIGEELSRTLRTEFMETARSCKYGPMGIEVYLPHNVILSLSNEIMDNVVSSSLFGEYVEGSLRMEIIRSGTIVGSAPLPIADDLDVYKEWVHTQVPMLLFSHS